ncbi:MAG: outer membrane protein [Saprospiraceae bacterium]|jgi:outer membrane protein
MSKYTIKFNHNENSPLRGLGDLYNAFKFVLFFLILTTQTIAAQESTPLTLSQALNTAQTKSLKKAEATQDLEITRLNAKIFAADLKPQLTGFANFPNYARTFQEVVQPNGTIAFQPIRNNNSSVSLLATQRLAATGGLFFLQTNIQRFDDFENDQSQYNGLPFRLGFQQEIFGFNPWKWNKKQLPIEQTLASKKFAYDQEQIHVEVTRLYFSLLIATQDADISKTNLENNQELLKIAEKRFELGKISENNYLQLQLEAVNSEKNKAAAEQEVKFASYALQNYLGETSNKTVILPVLPVILADFTVNEKSAVDYAINNRFETEDYILQIMDAERNLEQVKKETGLNVSLNASIGYSRSATDIPTIYKNPQNEQFLQMSLSVPIVDWGKRQAQVEQQEIAARYTSRSVEQQKTNFETVVKNSVTRLQTVQNQLSLAEKSQEIAKKRFDIAKQSFVLGAISTTELGIAQQEKDFALRDYILTLSSYWVGYYELRRNTLFDFATGVKL